MATRRTAPQSSPQAYPGLGDIPEPATQRALRYLFDQVNALRGSPQDPGWKADFHAGEFRLTALGDAEQSSDAVTLRQLVAATDPKRFQTALSIGGDAPLNITQLIGGQGGALYTGTHADRLATAPALGNWFYETDRNALYGAPAPAGTTWQLIVGSEGGSDAAKPADLTATDIGYLWFSQDRGTLLRWTGATWKWEVGTYAANFASRPTAGTLSAASGVLFAATDLGSQLWRFVGGGPLWQYAGGGEPTRDTLVNITGGLASEDEGYLFDATDYDRVYRWNGSAYADAPGQPARYGITLYDGAPDTNGWALCDGATVDVSQPDGTETSLVLPDLVTGTPFLRLSSSSAASANFGAVGATYPAHELKPYMRL